MAKIVFWAYFIIGLTHSAFVVYFALREEIDQVGTKD